LGGHKRNSLPRKGFPERGILLDAERSNGKTVRNPEYNKTVVRRRYKVTWS